mgnify:CR=1 FL=1
MVVLYRYKRKKKNDHINRVFLTSIKIAYEKRALSCGDYSFYIKANQELAIPRDLYFDNQIYVERKASLDELAINFYKRAKSALKKNSQSQRRRQNIFL